MKISRAEKDLFECKLRGLQEGLSGLAREIQEAAERIKQGKKLKNPNGEKVSVEEYLQNVLAVYVLWRANGNNVFGQ